MSKKISLVIIGGGTGSSVLIEGLRHYPVELTAIIPTSDSGGSTGVLRRELGIPSAGDIRQCVLALGDFSNEGRALWNYRFTRGTLVGHPVGNLIIAARIAASGSVARALQHATRFWKLHGSIEPVTDGPTTLCARYEDGTTVCDEHAIDEPSKLHGGIARVYFKKGSLASRSAVRAIKKARLIVLAPGDPFTSVIPVLLARGMREALRGTKAPIAYVANLMTKRGQTDGFTLSKLVGTFNAYLGSRGIDTVIVNTAEISRSVLQNHRRRGEYPISIDREHPVLKKKCIIFAPLIGEWRLSRVHGDRLVRSFSRHDPAKLARAVMRIILRGT